jgi:hypothetical protein
MTSSNLTMLKEVVHHLVEEGSQKRKTMIKEDKNIIKSFVRQCIREVHYEIKNHKIKENTIRKIIRNLILEAEATGGAPEAPSDITAMNFLKNLLKNIVPNIEEDYKQLTSAKKQRISFRKHILNASENLLNNLDADPEAIESELEEITVKIQDDDKPEGFIDIYDGEDKKKEPEEELDPQEEFAKGLEQRELDKTGRNAAFESFNKIQNQIENEYSKLDADTIVDGRDETEREIFRDYLLLNLKLYFDKFEEDLSPDLEEPSTPSEEEYVKTAQSRGGSGDELIPPEEVPAI